MKKLFSFNMVTLDGFFEGLNHDITWHNVDAEFNDFAIAQLDAVDALLFGRVTYSMMASYWPTPAAIHDDPVVAGKMNSISKFVFSKTLDGADWNNTRLVKDDAAREVARLKEQPGKDLAIFGSAGLTASLANEGLIDEYRIMVNPVVLGKGRSLFEGVQHKIELKLMMTRAFGNGNVLLYYQADGK